MRMMVAGLAAMALTAGALTVPVPARAQAPMDSREGIALQNEILDLRNQVQQLQAQQGGGGAPPPAYAAPPQSEGGSNDLVASLLARVQNLEEQVRELRGHVEDLGNQVRQQGQDFSKQIGDLNFQLQGHGAPPGASLGGPPPDGEEGPPPQSMSPPPHPLGQTHAEAEPPRPPELSLQSGYAALARRDYKTAEAAARQVIAKDKGPRAYDAQYLLARSLAGQHNWQKAVLAYDDTYNRNRKGNHAADSLLGMADGLIAINEKPSACATLDKLHREFPDAEKSAAAPLRKRADCH